MRCKLRHNNKHYTIVLLMGLVLLCGSFGNKGGSFSVKTVVIDAGHGGKDPGCSGLVYKEKDVALAVALKLGKYIEQNCKGVRVIYTRKTDVFVELQERAAIANRNNADLFICIHCNANPNKDAHGSETYVMGLNKTRGNLDVARRENASILLEDNYKKNYAGFDPNSDEANIIFSMYQNKHLEQALNLSSRIQNEYKDKARRTDKGVKQAGFLVLWKTAMTSLLTETGFLTNPREERFLGSEVGQDYLALSIFQAFREYKDDMEGRKVKYNDDIENRPAFTVPPDSETVTLAAPRDSSVPGRGNKTAAIRDTSSPVRDISDHPPENKPAVTADNRAVAAKDSSKATPDVFFCIQIITADSRIPEKSDRFRGLENIKEYIDRGQYKYLAGHYLTLEESVKHQSYLRNQGFKDAFVVAFRGDSRISIVEAKKLLKK